MALSGLFDRKGRTRGSADGNRAGFAHETPADRTARSRFPRLSRRSLAVLAGTALLAYGAGSSAAVNVFHARAPSLALALDGDDPVALVRDAQMRISAGATRDGEADSIRSVVARSVRELPLNGPAFRLYGLASAANSDLPGVRAQMALSDRMERRDVAAQLWLIEDAVEQNEIERALSHYDKALRIRESSRAILYPALTGAMTSPLIRERFVPYMQDPAPWLESFLRYAVSKSDDPVAIAALVRAAGGFPDGPAFATRDTELLGQLVATGEYEAAIAHYRGIEGSDPGVLTSLALTAASTDNARAPVTWQPFQIDGIEPYILGASDGEGVEIEADLEAGYKGPIARKLLALAPGRYDIEAGMRAEDFRRGDNARWTIVCAGQESQPVLLDEEVALGETMRLSARMTVPADCPVQTVQVNASTRFGSGFVTLVLAKARISPAQTASDTDEDSTG